MMCCLTAAYFRAILNALGKDFKELVFLDDIQQECPNGKILGILLDWSWDQELFIKNVGLIDLATRHFNQWRPAVVLGWRDVEDVQSGPCGDLLKEPAIRYVSLVGDPFVALKDAVAELRNISCDEISQSGLAAWQSEFLAKVNAIIHLVAKDLICYFDSIKDKSKCHSIDFRKEIAGKIPVYDKQLSESLKELDSLLSFHDWLSVPDSFSNWRDQFSKFSQDIGLISNLITQRNGSLDEKACVQVVQDLGELQINLRHLTLPPGQTIKEGTAVSPKHKTSSQISSKETQVKTSFETTAVNQAYSGVEQLVLMVDDEASRWLDDFNTHLGPKGYRFIGVENVDRALACIREKGPDAVLLDVLFPDKSGYLVNRGHGLLAAIHAQHPGLPVVMFTTTLTDDTFLMDQQDYETAAYLFAKETLTSVPEGIDAFAELEFQLRRAIEQAAERQPLDNQLGFVVGNTQRMLDVGRAILRVADTASTVLITGETGTGKELVARAIHRLSPRREKAFVALNCGGLTDETLESRLFGHTRGAFTGAAKETGGFFGEAEGGTLFLDEVELMSPRFQELLLRVLQDKKVTKMGSSREQSCDVRILAATNQDLAQRVMELSFRRDLYQRLAAYEIDLPSLRERLTDIPALFNYVVHKKNAELGLRVLPLLREDVARLFSDYDWPGNIRQLENVIHAAMVDAKSNVLTLSTFSLPTRQAPAKRISVTGLTEEILAGRADWSFLRDIKGSMRRDVLETIILQLKQKEGKRPTSACLAKVLKTSGDNLRRVLSESGIELRNY